MIPARWRVLAPRARVQGQVHQKEAKDFPLALLLLPGAWATSFSVAAPLGPEEGHFKSRSWVRE